MSLCLVLYITFSRILPALASDVWYDTETFRLPKREAARVGYEREIRLLLDRTHVLKTLSINPAVFEIKNFLTSEECEYLIHLAKSTGLQDSPTKPEIVTYGTSAGVFQQWDVDNSSFIEPVEFTYIKGKGDIYLTETDVLKMLTDLGIDKKMSFGEFRRVTAERIMAYFSELYDRNSKIRSRSSKQTWLWHYAAYDHLIEGFHERLSRLTMLPHHVIEMSEPMQVVKYDVGGHYHCHHDSDEVEPDVPCCTYQQQHKCRLCRYLTVMFFLNNVTGGGETAFQVADNETFTYEDWVKEAPYKCNLSAHCHESNLVYKPTKGTALLWYNHRVDETNGWLGELDSMTFHGGCDVTRDTKWIANTWVNIIGAKGSRDSFKGWLGKKINAEL